MKWRICITAFISFITISFPANIIGCSDAGDPYDYYTSFFHPELSDAASYQPFYYIGTSFLYDYMDTASASDELSKEWAAYCGGPVTKSDAIDFVIGSPIDHIDSLYTKTRSKKRSKFPFAATGNGMENYFLQRKDPEALQYIIYAKKVEPYVIGDGNYWEPISRDSVAMDSLINTGLELIKTVKKDFFKLKYGYQLVRLAHYSYRYADAIKWYDEFVAGTNTKSILQPMCTALKAGALLRVGRSQEAAYLFSKAFSETEINRISNYISFKWSVNNEVERKAYLSFCKTNDEKASLLALLSFGSTANEIPTLKEVYNVSPANKLLEVLAVREINKLEETYFSQQVNSQKGGAQFYYYWINNPDEGSSANTVELAEFLHTVAQSKKTINPGLFETGAAYCYFMLRDYAKARACVESARKMNINEKVKDQLYLTDLLITVNSRQKIDVAFEAQILPSIRWLQQKSDGASNNNSYARNWQFFYRNFMNDVMAKKYHQQGDIYKEAMMVGAASRINESYGNYLAAGFLHNNMASKDVEQLYAMMTNPVKTEYEQYLVNYNSLVKSDVVDFAGTAYLREYKYEEAIKWFKKTGKLDSYQVATDPFIDLLYDQVEAIGEEKGTTKLAFATEMLRLEKLSLTDKKNAAKYYYKMATGMYNMTYYGHAWQLVQYDRSGSEFSNMLYDTGGDKPSVFSKLDPFQHEYYGCFTAHDYFKKAMNTSADKNFKARCLFMMGKCLQKSFQEDDVKFTNNKYFPQFTREYGKTAFYKEAFNSCSYLRDFIKKK